MNTYIFLLLTILVTLFTFHVKTIEGIVPDSKDKTDKTDKPINQELDALKTKVINIDSTACGDAGTCGETAITAIKDSGKEMIDKIKVINDKISLEKTAYMDQIDSLRKDLQTVSDKKNNPPGMEKLQSKLDDAQTLHSKAAQSYKQMASLYSCNQNELDGGKCKKDAEDAVTDKLKDLLDDRCKLKDSGVDPSDPDIDMGMMSQLLKHFSNAKCKKGADNSLSLYEQLIKQHEDATKNGGGGDPELNNLLQKLIAKYNSIDETLGGVTGYSDKIYVADEGKCGTCDRRRRSSYNVLMDPNLQKQCTVKKRKNKTTLYSCPEIKPHESKANTFRVCHECQYPVEIQNDSKTQAFLLANKNRNQNVDGGLFTQGGSGSGSGIRNGTPFNINTFEYKTFTDNYDSGPSGYYQPIDTNNYT